MKLKYILKGVFFFVFIIGAVALYLFTPLKEIITPENIRILVENTDNWGPIVFILIYAGGICVFLPATLFTEIGAILFGTFPGFLFNILGAMLGASLAFLIGRYLGRDLAASVIGHHLKKYDEKIAENGFATILYLRLIFFPFSPLNFGMGLTAINFRDYFFGTFFGIIAGGFAMTFFFATLGEVWASHDWSQLYNLKAVFALVLFSASFFIPKVAKKLQLINSH